MMNEKETTSRVDFFCNYLSPKFDAEYYGISDQANVKNKFAIDQIIQIDKSSLLESNCIVGKKEDYEFCIFEYSYLVEHRTKYSSYKTTEWEYILSVRFPENYNVDFQLGLKSSEIIGSIIVLSLLSPLTLMFVFGVYWFIINFFKTLSESPSQILMFMVLIVPLLLLCVPTYFFIRELKTTIKNFSQDKYGIRHERFKKKYIIKNDTNDVEGIKKLFTSVACERILRFRPEIESMKCKNNCIIDKFYGKVQSISDCEKLVDKFVAQAKMFSKG